MGHDHYLAVLREPGEPTSDLNGDLATNPGIDLIEDQRASLVIGSKNDFQGEPHSRQLTTRGHPAEAAQLAPRIGCEQQLDPVGTRRPELGACYLKAQSSVRHRQGSEFINHQIPECGRSLATSRADLRGELDEFDANVRNALFQRVNPLITLLELGKPDRRLGSPL
jgi:hypothetical protein